MALSASSITSDKACTYGNLPKINSGIQVPAFVIQLEDAILVTITSGFSHRSEKRRRNETFGDFLAGGVDFLKFDQKKILLVKYNITEILFKVGEYKQR